MIIQVRKSSQQAHKSERSERSCKSYCYGGQPIFKEVTIERISAQSSAKNVTCHAKRLGALCGVLYCYIAIGLAAALGIYYWLFGLF